MNLELVPSKPSDLQQFMGQNLVNEFIPFACYDKHMDCIRVQLSDCSFTEQRLNPFLTILEKNHASTSDFIGCTIKGVRHLFETLGLEPKGIIPLVEIIDSIIKIYPDHAAKVIQDFTFSSEAKDLSVNFADAA